MFNLYEIWQAVTRGTIHLTGIDKKIEKIPPRFQLSWQDIITNVSVLMEPYYTAIDGDALYCY